MWPHFTHLFWRIVHGMPVLVSSNWASWTIGIGSFLLVLPVSYSLEPQTLKRQRELPGETDSRSIQVIRAG